MAKSLFGTDQLLNPLYDTFTEIVGYKGDRVTVQHVSGSTFIYSSSSTATVDGVCILSATGKGSGRWMRTLEDGKVNVLWYGAKGDGATDDAPAIQAAINFAKRDIGVYATRTVYMPYGVYKINSTLNLADTYSMCLKGDSNRVGCTVILGNTAGIALDFTGSTKSGVRDIDVAVPNGNSQVNTPSTIGVQFALSKDSANQATAGPQKGGLNCYMDNVSILMGSFPSANGGLGSVCLMNCRSEEFSLHNCDLQGNTGAVFTTQNNLNTYFGYNYTITSAFIPVQDDNNGSMGVVNWTGQCSIKCFEWLTPALALNGVNGFNFHGYIGRISGTTGSYEAAIRCVNQTFGLKVHATIESYSQILSLQNTLENSELMITTANHRTPSTPVVLMEQYSVIRGSSIKIGFGNPSEINGRTLFYTAPINSGNDPTNATIISSDLTSTAFPNKFFISRNLLKQSQNINCYSLEPFAKKGPYIVDLRDYDKGLGTVQSGNTPVTASIKKFDFSDRTTTSSGNGGYYQARVRGNVWLGSYTTGNGPCITHFEGWVSVMQGSGGNYTNQAAQDSKILILNKSTYNGGYLAINDLALAFNFSGSVPSLDLTISTGGSGSGEGIHFQGTVELLTDFAVNQSLIFD